MVVALSRFGTFSNLRTTTSAADDVYPSTPTFTFYGADYTSPYLAFSSVELESNVRSGGQYRALQTPTADQQQLSCKRMMPLRMSRLAWQARYRSSIWPTSTLFRVPASTSAFCKATPGKR